MNKLILILSVLLLNPLARADDADTAPPGITLLKLFTIANDRDANVDRFNLMIDEQKLAAGVLLNTNSGRVDNQAAETPHYFRDIARADGVVLIEGQGRKVLLLQGQLNRDTQEGRFKLTYLANGLSNKYESCDMLLKKDGAAWHIENAYNHQKVTSVKIITWSLGLKTLQGICP